MDPKTLKLLEQYSLDKNAQGCIRIISFNPLTNEVNKVVEKRNTILFEGADILALLIAGQSDYNVSAMYIEYENLASPGDPITPPTFDRSGGVAYYNGLGASPTIDFLRVPITVSPAFSTSGTDYENNIVTFFGVTEGTVGFHGKTFSPSSNSAVFGAALVAAPDLQDQSQDKVYARTYTGIDKVLKQTGFEIGVTWQARFN